MDFAELKNKSAEELREMMKNFRNEIRVLRFKLKSGGLKQHQKYGELKNDVARVCTALSASVKDDSAKK